MPKRIAVLFEYPTLNGGERSMLQALKLIDRQEFELVALAPASGRLAGALHRGSVQHVPFDLHDPREVRMSREAACLQLVATTRPLSLDLLHANSLSMGRLTGAAADQLAMPCTAHLRDIIGLSRAAINDLNRNRVLIAVSQATQAFHVAQGLAAEHTRVIHNGVDSACFRPRPQTHALCRELNLPRDAFIILTVGQIGLRKGQDVLAAAAPAISARVPGAQYVIVGERNSSKEETVVYEANLKTTLIRVGLGERIHFLGYRDDVERLMNEADLLVHSAKQEPLGRVLLEAAAAELPIVATDVGGTTEILTDGLSARLVAPGDPVQLSNAVIELAEDKPLRERLAATARKRILTEFTPQAVADKLMEVWRQVVT